MWSASYAQGLSYVLQHSVTSRVALQDMWGLEKTDFCFFMIGTDEYKSVWLSLVMTEQTRRHKSSEFQFEFLKHYRFWFVFLGVPNFQPLTCDSKVSLFSWRKRRKMNCLIRYPCDSEKYEKNNLTYHSWITPCGVIKQNCMEYWYEPAESSFRTKRKKME